MVRRQNDHTRVSVIETSMEASGVGLLRENPQSASKVTPIRRNVDLNERGPRVGISVRYSTAE